VTDEGAREGEGRDAASPEEWGDRDAAGNARATYGIEYNEAEPPNERPMAQQFPEMRAFTDRRRECASRLGRGFGLTPAAHAEGTTTRDCSGTRINSGPEDRPSAIPGMMC